MRLPTISLEQLASLPEIYRLVIPPEYEDRNGHMNIRWYLVIYDEAGDAMYPLIGLTDQYFATSGMGGFDLEHHIWYRSEVRVGDTVTSPIADARANSEALPLPDVYDERDPRQSLLGLPVRARPCRPKDAAHCCLRARNGRQNRYTYRSAACPRLGRPGLWRNGHVMR